MRTFILIHGAGDSGWYWHLVASDLRARGCEVIVPDLPADDDALTLSDYADAVIPLAEGREHVTVVGHSFGGFTAPLVAEALAAEQLIYLAGMVPMPGETPDAWWTNTGYNEAVARQAAHDGGLTGNPDPLIEFYHDVPSALAQEALRRGRNHPSPAAMAHPWPAAALPEMPTRFILCQDDRCFPADFFRALIAERLGLTPEEIPGSHCVALSRPAELADLLIAPRRAHI